jgi:hypothetical protein
MAVSTLIAVVTSLAAAMLLGLSAVADQRSTKRVKTRKALSPRIVADLVRQPLWLAAIGANVAGFALQVVALSFGSLALVQPILVGDLVFAALIARYLARREGAPRLNARQLYGGVIATTLGVAGFLAIGQPSGGRNDVGFAVLPPVAVLLVVVVGGSLVVAARNENLRPIALALACGFCYGVAAFSIKLVTSEFGGGPERVFTNWPIYMFAVVGPAGFILNQDALQQGRFLAPVQAIISAADPIISIGLGIWLLDVRLRGGAGPVAGEVISLIVMTTGITVLAFHAPMVTPTQAPTDAQADAAPGG